MTACNRTDCDGGTIDETGFCGTCSRRPRAAPPRSTTGPAGPPMAAGPWWGRGLVPSDPARPDGEPDPVFLTVTQVPVARRICAAGDHLVGQDRDQGNCPADGAAYDFAPPPLRPGDALDHGHYRVRGVLGRGGFGWAYLADDTRLGRLVVLKGLIQAQVAIVEQERARLIGLEHRYIVRICDYVRDGHHLVLDYAGGSTLQRVPTWDGASDGELARALAHGLQLLEALDYLHGQGYLHCDVKPANIVRGGDGIRLIDFGAVRTIAAPSPVTAYTPEYCPPPGDPERMHPTAAFDLYCAARTLAEVCEGFLTGPDVRPVVESLRLVLGRAAHAEAAHRFRSAGQFAEQLSGVIQQLTGAPSAAHRSVVFAAMTQPLDGGLGDVLPLPRWAGARAAGPGVLHLADPAFECPAAGQVAGALPAVLADPWDAGGEASGDAPAVVEAQLSACHAAVAQGDPGAAATLLRETRLPEADWRADWYRGLILLARGAVAEAAAALQRVRAAVPGELVPILALGLCAELDGQAAVAALHYEMASATDESLIPAHFGRARMLLADEQRADAARTLRRVPAESRFDRAARLGAVRSHVAVITGGERRMIPCHEDLQRAQSLRKGLEIDSLSAALLDLEFANAAAAAEAQPGMLSGAAPQALEKALRGAARLAESARSHTALINLANAVRPVTLWSW
jgi:serine/threonine-protein kinase PknG